MRLHFVLAVCILFFSHIKAESIPYSVGPAPAWVKPISFAQDPPVKPSQINFQLLLDDNQENWEEKTTYQHYARKILTQGEAQSFSQVSIAFDPSYQSLIFHDLRVWRNGVSLDRLQTCRSELLQRERGLEDNLYEGALSLIYFLSDIRVGDTVEYSYSIRAHPVFSTHYFTNMVFQEKEAVEKMHYRILLHPEHVLRTKSFFCALEPQIMDLSPTLREWTWEASDTLPCKVEEDTPDWYSPYAKIVVSEYPTWKDFVEHMLPLYTLPEDICQSSEMMALVEGWKEKTQDPVERATYAARFVQDEVKYLGFEQGVGGHKPTDPRVVLANRFGDCKDKTFLLKALLQLLDITAEPVLVHSKKGKLLPDILPGSFFDHVVLQISIDGKAYWIDATMSHQKGSLENNFFPSFYWGLVVSKDTTELTPMPFVQLKNPIEVFYSIIFTSPQSAALTSKHKWHGYMADDVRRQIEEIGLKEWAENLLKNVQKQYKGAKQIDQLIIEDDMENNVLSSTVVYQISSRARPGKRFLKVESIVHEHCLHDNIHPDRSQPYQLAYPMWVNEHIHVENPFGHWDLDAEDFHKMGASFEYHYEMKKEGSVADFHYELKHLSDHVPVESITDYWDFVRDVESHSSHELYIAPAGLPPKP